MDVFDLQAKISLDTSGFKRGLNEAAGNMQSFGSTVEGIIKGIEVAFTTAFAAAATGTAALVKSAVEEYARFEQMVGGVDTLFKDSSDALQANADAAYQTAGMSANDYMDSATSFAASLIQALGGDTAAAVGMVDMAVTDMADNINTFGGDMTMVENAYKGFARNSYVMLDNLKLGYSGTKSEMARLINDTGILGDTVVTVSTMTEQGNFDQVVSFATVVEAIHAVQENLGITGRTAQEASGTIEGSVNAMKAAWSNWQAGLADPDADMTALTDNLVSSFQTAADNVVPAVQRIGDSLGQVFTQLTGIDLTPVTAVFDQLKTSLADIGTAFTEGGIGGGFEAITAQIESLTGLDLSGMTEGFAGIGEAFADIGTAFTEGGIGGGFDELVSGFESLTGIDLSGLKDGIGEFFSEIVTVDDSTLTSVGGAIQSLIGAFSGVDVSGIISGAATAIGDFLGVFDDAAETAISFVSEIVGQLARDFEDMAPGIAGVAAGIGIFVGGLTAMQAFSGIPTLLTAISTAFTALNTVMAANPILLVVSVLGALAAALVTAYHTNEDFRNSVDQAWASIKEGAATALENLKKTLSGIGEAISEAAGVIKEKVSEFLQAGRDLIQGLIDGITEKLTSAKTAITGAFGKVTDWVKGVFDINSPSKVFADIGRNLMRGLAVGVDDEAGVVQDSIDKLRLTVPAITTGKVDFASSALGRSTTAMMNGMISAGGSSGGAVNVNLNVDGRTLAQVVYDPLNGLIKQKGVVLGA